MPLEAVAINHQTHTSASSAGAGPMELVSMACPSVVRGRIIIIIKPGKSNVFQKNLPKPKAGMHK
jgi:hypothetical protein